MKVPIRWLKEYVTFEATPQELADRLTFSGIEVEEIATIGSDYCHVVVGEVLEIRPHPGSDRLRLCTVSDGQHGIRVVCGASNFSIGDKVPLALVGAVLPGGVKISRAKIRGEASDGMLCAEDELGISDDHSGIMLLPRGTVAGTPFGVIAGPPETVLDLEITWNRPDCLCIIGIAREVAALFGSRLRLPPTPLQEADSSVDSLARVTIEAADLCPRYTARVLTEAAWVPSPAWMQKRLRLCGVRPISSVVDITNYVMLECGHPLHAFDYTRIADRHIFVRRARAGEAMSTLDGASRALTPEALVIADAERPVAVAGIMGGAGSEIGEGTRTVLLESATFNPASIHATSLALGLKTESSYRFERGVSAAGAEWASRRAAQLMAEHAGASVARGVIDAFPGKAEERRVACRFARLRDLLGIDLSADRIVAILDSLQLPVVARDETKCTVQVPDVRGDIELEADLIEEVARIHGLDKVPAAAPVSRIVPGVSSERTRALLRCRSNLAGLGLTEVMNYSFVSRTLLDLFSKDDAERRVVLPNPVSSDFAVMRNSLVPQMVETMGRNLARQTREAACFEVGRTFLKESDGRIQEEERIALGLMGGVGHVGVDARKSVSPEESFLWIKGIVVNLCSAQHVEDVRLERIDHPYFCPGWAMNLTSAGQPFGVMGLIHQRIAREWRMTEPVAVAEIALGEMLQRTFVMRPLTPVPVFPAVARDVALVVDAGVTHGEIEQTIRAAGPRELTGIQLFDIFTNKEMGAGKKSLAYSLTYRSTERTLTDEEANTFHDAVKKALKDELKAEIRES